MSGKVELDFDVVREPWNKYELADGSYIKSKYVLMKVKKVGPDEQGKASLDVGGQPLIVSYNVPKELRGSPSTELYSPEQILKAVESEVRYNTISEDWNEYLLEDTTRIRVKITVSRVLRTKLFNRDGEPIYHVDHAVIVQGSPPKRT